MLELIIGIVLSYGILLFMSCIMQLVAWLLGKNIGNLNTWIKRLWKRYKTRNTCNNCKGQWLIIQSFANKRVMLGCTRCGDTYGTDAKDYQHAERILKYYQNMRKN